MILTEKNLLVMVLAPDADRYTADPATDIVNLKNYRHATFIVNEGAGGTGTAVITVEECSDNAGTGATAIAFKSRVGAYPDVLGAIASAAAAGYTTIAGANKFIVIEIDADELADDKPWVRLQITESVDSPVDASVICILSGARYEQATPP